MQELRLMTEDELRTLSNQIHDEIQHRGQMKKHSLNVQDKVTFISSRKGNATITGTITKINRTRALVKDDNTETTWRVPFSMLSKLS